MRSIAAVIASALLACTQPMPSETAPTQPVEAAQKELSCDEGRQRELLRAFFDGYNARDLGRVTAAFSSDQYVFDFYDNVDGEAVQLRDHAAFRAYLERRWALDDRFLVDTDTIYFSARFPNPTFSFGRTSVQGSYVGNAKFICSGGVLSGVVTSSAATTRTACPETPPSAGHPADSNTASFSRRWWASTDNRMWASRPDRLYVSGNKVLWERPASQPLEISGHPRGASGPQLNAHVPSGYENLGYQASGIDFPVAGCWEVTARAGGSELLFITEVYPESYRPPTPRCRDVGEAVSGSQWVLEARVEGSALDRPGFVKQHTTVTRTWKGSSAPAGHQVTVWQDAFDEPLLERGRTYVLFLAMHSYGSPAVQYGLTRILCPMRTIIEVRGTDLVRPPSYAPADWIWRGGDLSELERELAKLSPNR